MKGIVTSVWVTRDGLLKMTISVIQENKIPEENQFKEEMIAIDHFLNETVEVTKQ